MHDLDRFEEINDVYGHSAGDRFLAEVGRRLALACDGAFLARLGGDEFTIVSSGGVQPAATPSAMTGSASVRPRPRMACMIAAAGECLPILAFLMKEGCNEVQGYLIGRPQPIDRYRHATAKIAGAPELAAIAG